MAKLKEGVKFDDGKLQMDLLPVIGLLLEGDVYTRGSKKYDSHNWRKGLKWSRVEAALFRHLLWWKAGERIDPDDGQHHLAAIKWAAGVLMEFEITHPELDDRYIPFPPEKLRQLLADMKGKPNVKEKSKKRTTKKRPRNKKKHL